MTFVGDQCAATFALSKVAFSSSSLKYAAGAGSSLLKKQKKLHEIIASASSVLKKRGMPFTVKMRTGFNESENIAHQIIPKIFSSGAAVVCLHGRTRQQRYSKLADWNYIKECVASAGGKPIIGNGDIYTFEEYHQQVGSDSPPKPRFEIGKMFSAAKIVPGRE